MMYFLKAEEVTMAMEVDATAMDMGMDMVSSISRQVLKRSGNGDDRRSHIIFQKHKGPSVFKKRICADFRNCDWPGDPRNNGSNCNPDLHSAGLWPLWNISFAIQCDRGCHHNAD